MARTISDLNSKWWYRLIKVVYLFILVLAVVSCFVGTYEYLGGFGTVDTARTRVVCNPDHTPLWSDAPSNLSIRTLGIEAPSPRHFKDGHLDLKDYFSTLSYVYDDKDARKIIAACGGNPDLNDRFDAYVLQRLFEMKASNMAASSTMPLSDAQREELNEIIRSQYVFQKEQKLAFSPRAFDIEPQYTYLPYPGYVLLFLAITLLVFEVIRRIFYYVVLGSVFPNKKEQAV